MRTHRRFVHNHPATASPPLNRDAHADSALRTTTPRPIIGGRPPISGMVRTPHCGQHRPHPLLVDTHELYESTQHPRRLKTQLGKREHAVDSCTTGVPHEVLVAPDACGLPHCGQQRQHPLLVDTHETSPCGRSAAGGVAKPDNAVSRPGKTLGENRPLVNFCETVPAGLPTPPKKRTTPPENNAPEVPARTCARAPAASSWTAR